MERTQCLLICFGASLISLFAIRVAAQSNIENSSAVVAFNMGPSINSSEEDMFPSLSNDGTTLYFTSRRKLDGDQVLIDRLFYCQRDELQAIGWGAPQPLTAFNTPVGSGSICFDSVGGVYVSANTVTRPGNIFAIFAGRAFPGHPPRLEQLPWPINSEHTWNCQMSVTADGRTMYFVSNRTDVDSKKGNSTVNIYVSHKINDTTWGMPIHLGKHVNRPRYSGTPCISPDGSVLLFSAERVSLKHYLSIYYVKRTGPGDDDWSEPVELPAPINGAKHAMSPAISPDGKTIYFASDREGGHGGLDLYFFPLPASIQADIGKAFVR